MNDPFLPRVGGILSADIAVPEHERELRFYSRVLGTGESPLWREDLMNNRGMPVIGLGERTEEYASLPLQWMPHIQVADVARSVERAVELGGTALMHGKNEQGESLWGVLLDPNGAAFGVMPVVSAAELPSGDASASPGDALRAGCIAGIELTVPDASATRDFYHQVVGWSVQDLDKKDARGRDTDYDMRAEDGAPAARVRRARGEDEVLPPVWMLRLPVADLAESLSRAEEAGGRILEATRGTDGAYAYAAIQDPVGACLALVPG